MVGLISPYGSISLDGKDTLVTVVPMGRMNTSPPTGLELALETGSIFGSDLTITATLSKNMPLIGTGSKSTPTLVRRITRRRKQEGITIHIFTIVCLASVLVTS